MDKKDYELTAMVTRLANRGARKSIELAKKKGVPNPFVYDGKLMYKLPNGKISETAKF
jgi:hypothetical protein